MCIGDHDILYYWVVLTNCRFCHHDMSYDKLKDLFVNWSNKLTPFIVEYNYTRGEFEGASARKHKADNI
jgi:hypothetical protein